VPCGLAIYMAYLWRTFDNPLLFADAEQRWRRYFALPYVTAWQALKDGYWEAAQVVAHGHLSHLPAHLWQGNTGVFNLTNLVVLIVAVVLIALGWRRLGAPYNSYAVLAVLFMLCNPAARQPLASLPRYALVVFPLYMALAACTQRRPLIRWLVVSVCLVGLAWLTARFVLFAWVA